MTTEEVAAGKEGRDKFVAVLAFIFNLQTFLTLLIFFVLLIVYLDLFISSSFRKFFLLLPTCSRIVASIREFLPVSPAADESMYWGSRHCFPPWW